VYANMIGGSVCGEGKGAGVALEGERERGREGERERRREGEKERRREGD
jgi:hypothetical protein